MLCLLVYTYRSCEDFYPVLQFIFALSSLIRKLGEVAGEKGRMGRRPQAKVAAWDSQKLCYMGATFYDILPERRVWRPGGSWQQLGAVGVSILGPIG